MLSLLSAGALAPAASLVAADDPQPPQRGYCKVREVQWDFREEFAQFSKDTRRCRTATESLNEDRNANR